MEVQRAQQIVESRDTINVEFQGVPVWIDSIDNQSKTASVHPTENPADRKTVALNELKEVH
ncbi:H-type small acid-soluble spore protein [Aneurinibacillus tyrosinisolvens]|uniref:H-type small acid-soluble spore protein n=1 Tax=Aneurinibacillus tyrosinisolvens TaxID=1443435 RepID=UPI00063F35AC|nr:H-type small acid-soluble spore protein [Aneurinibacillus tyrosinisolvens]